MNMNNVNNVNNAPYSPQENAAHAFMDAVEASMGDVFDSAAMARFDAYIAMADAVRNGSAPIESLPAIGQPEMVAL